MTDHVERSPELIVISEKSGPRGAGIRRFSHVARDRHCGHDTGANKLF
jgi:hypothetical protein